MKRFDFIFDWVNFLHYKSHEINLNRGVSFIYSPDCIKNKKATINPANNDDRCFQYAASVALNQEKIEQNRKEYQKLSLL